MDNNLKLLAVAGGALVVMACQSPTPRNAQLEQARFVYQLTLSDPYLAAHAAGELKQARRTLRAAERVWSDGGDEATTRTLARMATRQVEQARAAALGEAPADLLDADDDAPAMREAGRATRDAGGVVNGATPVRAQPVAVSRLPAAEPPSLRLKPQASTR